MRTVIFFGLFLIADAINKTKMEERTIEFISWIIIFAMIMDIVDFITDKMKI